MERERPGTGRSVPFLGRKSVPNHVPAYTDLSASRYLKLHAPVLVQTLGTKAGEAGTGSKGLSQWGDQSYLRISARRTGRVGSRRCSVHQGPRLRNCLPIRVILPEQHGQLPHSRKGHSRWMIQVLTKPDPNALRSGSVLTLGS